MKINIKMALVAGVISVSILAGGLPAEAHPGSKDNTTKVTTEKKSLQERIHAILYPEGDPEEKTVIDVKISWEKKPDSPVRKIMMN